MAVKEVALFLIMVLAVFGEARHTHPRVEQRDDTIEARAANANNDHDATETETKLMPKLSPHSSILFFKSSDPCEDGFKQDFQGICREVWF